MKLLFRTDASMDIGTGHVMRCLTLADAMRRRGASSLFVCRDHPGHLADLITRRGHQVELLPLEDARDEEGFDPRLGGNILADAAATERYAAAVGADWIVIDHYALDARWERQLRGDRRRIMVIDDLADRPHDCDLLLDQNLGRAAMDYDHLVDPRLAQVVVGPRYALLRPDFAMLRESSLTRRRKAGKIARLLISLGGVDRDNATASVLAALEGSALPGDCVVTIVMGPSAPWIEEVKEKAAELPWDCEIQVGVSDMARLMADTDLAIGAAGSTSWERCALGVPMLIAVLADNQREAAAALVDAGAAWKLELQGEGDRSLKQHLSRIFDNRALITGLSERAATICDGRGTERVANILAGEIDLLEEAV